MRIQTLYLFINIFESLAYQVVSMEKNIHFKIV